jgi:hypothetical protein
MRCRGRFQGTKIAISKEIMNKRRKSNTFVVDLLHLLGYACFVRVLNREKAVMKHIVRLAALIAIFVTCASFALASSGPVQLPPMPPPPGVNTVASSGPVQLPPMPPPPGVSTVASSGPVQLPPMPPPPGVSTVASSGPVQLPPMPPPPGVSTVASSGPVQLPPMPPPPSVVV